MLILEGWVSFLLSKTDIEVVDNYVTLNIMDLLLSWILRPKKRKKRKNKSFDISFNATSPFSKRLSLSLWFWPPIGNYSIWEMLPTFPLWPLSCFHGDGSLKFSIRSLAVKGAGGPTFVYTSNSFFSSFMHFISYRQNKN